MFQEEFTNTLQQLAHRGMSDTYSYRRFRSKKIEDDKKDVHTSKMKRVIEKSCVQLKLFEI